MSSSKSSSNSNSPQRQRREARRTKGFHQRLSLLSLLALAVSPSFVALYFSSTTHHPHNDHYHKSSIISTKSSLFLRPPSPLHKSHNNRRHHNGQIPPPLFPEASSRIDTRSMTQQQQQQQHQQPSQPKELRHGMVDSVAHHTSDDNDIENNNDNGHVVCQTTTITKQQQSEDIATTTTTLCCAHWEYNTDEWWLQHYDYEIQQENATHTCFGKITNPQRLAFLQRVERNQWQSQRQQKRRTSHHDKTDGIDIENKDASFCAHDVQVNQVSTGYAAALTSLTRSFAAALAQNRPFQYNKRHDRYHWNFSIRINNNNNTTTNDTTTIHTNDNLATKTTTISMTNNNATTLHWAYCPTQDMNCFYLPLGQCRPQLGRHDDGFRGKKPPSAGAAAQAAAVRKVSSSSNNIDTITAAAIAIQQERLDFLWLRRYAFRPRHALRHQLYLFLQQHLTPAHQQELARILAHYDENYGDTASQPQPPPQQHSSCTAIHVRRGDVAFGKGRRYAAVQEYLDAGNVSRILLTDDASTIDEVQEFHVSNNDKKDPGNHHEPSPQPYYHWIYIQRPRFLGSQGGFEGFIPSNDPAFEVLAILADMQLASYCPKLVHGKSGFVDLLVEERERAGKPVQTILLDIQQDKGSQPKLDPQERAQQYLQRIRQGLAAVALLQ
jgi:hypothetical protein